MTPKTPIEMVEEFHDCVLHSRPIILDDIEHIDLINIRREGLSLQYKANAFKNKFPKQKDYRPEIFNRIELLYEEFGELFIALSNKDKVGILDAIVDLTYVVLGVAVSIDLPFDEGFEEVHRSNMTKCFDGTPRGKGPGYIPPDLKRIIEETTF